MMYAATANEIKNIKRTIIATVSNLEIDSYNMLIFIKANHESSF